MGLNCIDQEGILQGKSETAHYRSAIQELVRGSRMWSSSREASTHIMECCQRHFIGETCLQLT